MSDWKESMRSLSEAYQEVNELVDPFGIMSKYNARRKEYLARQKGETKPGNIKPMSRPGVTGKNGAKAKLSGSLDSSGKLKSSGSSSSGGSSKPAAKPVPKASTSSATAKPAAGSKASINAKYDQMRKSGDHAGAKKYGMAQHKKLFNKGGSSSSSTSSGATSIGKAAAPMRSSVSSGASSIGKAAGGSSSSSGVSGIKSSRLSKALSNIPKFKAENHEYLIGHLIDEGYANDTASAEVILTHMSDQWLESFITD